MNDLTYFYSDELNTTDCKYIYSSNKIIYSCPSIAFNNKRVFKFSNDWLYKINETAGPIFPVLSSLFRNNKNKPPSLIISGKSVLLSTAFCRGTVHGYTGMYDILYNVLSSGIEYDNYLVNEISQQGIIDIISVTFPNNKIKFLKADTLYKINDLTLVPVKYHEYFYKSQEEVNYHANCIYPFLKTVVFKEIPNIYDSICILKSSKSTNLTSVGVFSYDAINAFCNKHNFAFIEPTKYPEYIYASIVQNATNIIFSWGSTYTKGLLYISELCKKVTVLIHNEYTGQYNTYKEKVPQKFRNATISYVIVNDIDLIII
jgi:hypothetical protein